ncbi:MAG: hypothetical protein KGI08_07495 [Thaumarchaeota archaeon]|nr:hypothetical protein [Nitrososphaerota archaeon]
MTRLSNCPECNYDFSKNPTTDIYAHAVSCMHLPGQGPKRDMGTIIAEKKRSAEHIERCKILLTSAMEVEK